MVPHDPKLGALGCLVGLAFVLLVVVLAGWWGQWGIFAPHHHAVAVPAPQTAPPSQTAPAAIEKTTQ